MAKPQLENGYTPIANEIMEALYHAKMTATEYRIVMLILRYTYGFRRLEHELSVNFIANALEIDRSFTAREINKLIEWNVIKSVARPNKYHSRVLAFNKNYEAWHCNTVPVACDTTVDSQYHEGVDQEYHKGVDSQYHKEIQNIKQNINKNILCVFFDSLWELYPCKKGKSKVSKKAMSELQEIGFDRIKQCIENYIAQKPDWQNWQNGSTFFNGGYKDYLEPEAIKPAESADVGGRHKWNWQ